MGRRDTSRNLAPARAPRSRVILRGRVPNSAVQIPGLSLALDERALAWRTTRHAGITWFPLHLGDAPAGAAQAHSAAGGARAPVETVVLIRMEPGCGYPAHTHVGVEDVLVLRGGYRDERGAYRAGAYVRYEAGSRHTPVALGARKRVIDAENPACVLFAIARAGTVVDEDPADSAVEDDAAH